ALAAPARAQTESGRLNVHLQLALTFSSPSLGVMSNPGDSPMALGLVGNAGFDWQFAAPLALDVNFELGHLGLFAGNGGEPRTYVASVGLRWRFLERAGGAGYLVPRAGYLLNRTDDSSYATVELEAGAEITVDGPVRLGPFFRVAAAFGGSNFGYF